MERSSPLAAMQPPSLPLGQWGCRGGAQSVCSEYNGGRLNFGSASFNFKDLSMAKAPMDYFSLKPVRGSSPTASLAADLSQNFHIDQSPQLPTPRRSLFSSNLFGTLNGRERTTTPPIPSSSPGPGNDSMEISPLPHKAPFVVTRQVDPTPEITPMEEDAPSSMDLIQDSPLDTIKQPAPLERRRPTLMRPSMSRAKGLSTTAISLKPARVECPPFKFGNGPSVPSTLMSPRECFESSPQGEKRPQSAHSPASQPMGPPRFKQPFAGLTGHSHARSNGSPIVGHVRKPSNPLQRPRKQFRRSLSMFEHPGDVIKQEKATFAAAGLDSIMDVDDTPQLQLPHFISGDESLPRITKETMVAVLDGKYGECYDRSVIIDCRFEYEYDGGHIEGAMNVNDKERLASQLFDPLPTDKALLIFHCEYSAHRAPIMAKFLRHKDRACNAHQYPKLNYPEVYILDGGYSSFFADHKLRCYPQSYVEMADKEHESACERGLGRIKQQRTKLCRAQTFAFGSHNQEAADSPTASARHSAPLMPGMDLAAEDGSILGRMQSRRMVSF